MKVAADCKSKVGARKLWLGVFLFFLIVSLLAERIKTSQWLRTRTQEQNGFMQLSSALAISVT